MNADVATLIKELLPKPGKLPKYVLTRNGKEKGQTTGAAHKCRLDGCSGWRITVRWPDGKLSYPCSRGMKVVRGATWQIQ